jgi:hypothetical protein
VEPMRHGGVMLASLLIGLPLAYWSPGSLTFFGIGLNNTRRVGHTLASIVASLNIVPNSVARPSGLFHLRLAQLVFLGIMLTLGIAGENLRRSCAQAVALRTRVTVDPASRPVASRTLIRLVPAALGLFVFYMTRPTPVLHVSRVWNGPKALIRIAIVPGV